ncbi:MAG: DUF928 domain-containing protein [Spirulina sp. SIO3F2]|nr:DUF928 domain-containing protein [Spirulina sp. SIO3F2]
MLYRHLQLGFALSLSVVLCTSQISTSFAQPASKPSGGEQSEPLSSRGGGSRRLCDGAELSEASAWSSLIALTPKADNVITTPPDQTSLYVYVPGSEGEETVPLAFVQIADMETEKIILQSQIFALNSNNAIVRLLLPDTLNLTLTTELSATQRYFWQLTILCDLEDEEADRYIEGWLQPLDTANALEPTWHEQLEDWFDQQDNHNNPAPWIEGLSAVGLGELSDLPVQTYELLLETEVTE